jgi:hypothetical protein
LNQFLHKDKIKKRGPDSDWLCLSMANNLEKIPELSVKFASVLSGSHEPIP